MWGKPVHPQGRPEHPTARDASIDCTCVYVCMRISILYSIVYRHVDITLLYCRSSQWIAVSISQHHAARHTKRHAHTYMGMG